MGLFSGIGKIVGGVAGGLFGGEEATEAARLQAAGYEKSYALQKQMYEKGLELTKPYRETGKRGLAALETQIMAGPGEFAEAPGYQFTLSEGLKAIERSASARHQQLSGRTLKDLATYAQGMASTEYDKFLNRYYASLQPYQTLAGIGQQATGQALGLGQAYAAGGGQALTGQAGAQAAGVLGQGQAKASLMNLGMSIAGMGLGSYLGGRGFAAGLGGGGVISSGPLGSAAGHAGYMY